MSSLIWVFTAMMVALVHLWGVWWLMNQIPPEKVTPVELFAIEWLEVAQPEPSITSEPTAIPEPVEMEETPAPEAAIVQHEVAPPPPPPEPVKPKPVKPITQEVKKLPVAKSVPATPVVTAQTTSEPQPVVHSDTSSVKQQTAPPAPATVTQAQADYLNNPKPAYPRLSKRMGEQGEVRLRVQIGTEGQVLQVQLETSSGYERLDDAAMIAVNGWRFKPAMRGNDPIISWVEIPITFKLEE